MAGDCGSCTFCCLVMGVKSPTLNKPKDTWCSQCEVGKGCLIYESRPGPCVDFSCVWLQSQERTDHAKQDEWMRPDRSKVMLLASPDGEVITGHCHPKYPLAWQEPRMLNWLTSVAMQGIPILIKSANGAFAFDKQGRVFEVELSDVDEAGVQTVVRKKPGGMRFKTAKVK